MLCDSSFLVEDFIGWTWMNQDSFCVGRGRFVDWNVDQTSMISATKVHDVAVAGSCHFREPS